MLNTTTLPETPQELKDFVIDLDARHRARIEFLEERVRFFQKQLFGRKSEKRPQELQGRQLELFNEAEALTEKPSYAETLVVPEHTRCRKTFPGWK